MKLTNHTTAAAAILKNGSPTSDRHMMGCVIARRTYASAAVLPDAAPHGLVCLMTTAAGPSNSFPIFSTLRQFRRYIAYWQRDCWKPLASSAIDALGGAPGASA